jgi:flavin-dependent dehydrogenase
VRNPTGYDLHIENGLSTTRTAAPHVLGADGVDSAAARVLPDHSLDAVALLQARVPLPRDLDADTVRVVFDRQATRFFFWLIPESPSTAVAGLIHDTPEEAQKAFASFLSDQALEPIGPPQAAPVPMAPIRLNPGDHSSGGPLMLIGDAAAQVKTTTVGGVVTGMRGARAAAEAILNDTSYAHELRPLRRELNAHSLLRAVLDGFTDDDYDRLLRLLNQGASQILSEHTRDELARGLWWRLIRAQPRWLTLTARAITRRLA